MFYDLIRKRRSIRKYKSKPVETEKIDKLIEAALRAPSSRSLNPWQFIVVTDPEMLARLARCKPHGASFLETAPLAIVVCGEEIRSDMWIEDCSIAGIFLHLAAQSLKLGSCWIQIRKRQHSEIVTAEDYMAELLHLPDDLKVEAIIAVGYPDETREPHEFEKLPFDKVHKGVFGEKFQG
ncbi:MAG: nitroreductase family protein [Planctomycetota bacterium]